MFPKPEAVISPSSDSTMGLNEMHALFLTWSLMEKLRIRWTGYLGVSLGGSEMCLWNIALDFLLYSPHGKFLNPNPFHYNDNNIDPHFNPSQPPQSAVFLTQQLGHVLFDLLGVSSPEQRKKWFLFSYSIFLTDKEKLHFPYFSLECYSQRTGYWEPLGNHNKTFEAHSSMEVYVCSGRGWLVGHLHV